MKTYFSNLFRVPGPTPGLDAVSVRARDEQSPLGVPTTPDCEGIMHEVAVCSEVDAAAHDDLFIEQGLRLLGENARIRGHRDYALGVGFVEGGRAFLRDGASPGEMTVYNRAWMRSALMGAVNATGLKEYVQ